MSIFGLEKEPIGPCARGLELQGQSRAGRAFTRWEAHYSHHTTNPDECYNVVAVLITATSEFPPQEKMWEGQIYSRQDFDPAQFKVWYRRMA